MPVPFRLFCLALLLSLPCAAQDDVKEVPVAVNCCDQISDDPGPPDFQTRYGVPLESMKDMGSIDPPSDFWHSSGPVEVSVKGP